MVPCGVEPFPLDSSFGGFVLFEDVECDAVEQGKVLRRVSGTLSAEVFAETDIQCPVQLVFDAPVLTDGAVQPRRVGLEAGDVVAGFALGFAGRLVAPLGLNAHQPM